MLKTVLFHNLKKGVVVAEENESYFRVLSACDQTDGQVSLAKELGYSIGKVNYILTALKDKGLVKMEHFSTSEHKRKYKYLLTPQGIKEKLLLTEAFIVRKKAEYEQLQQQLEQTKQLLKQQGNAQ